MSDSTLGTNGSEKGTSALSVCLSCPGLVCPGLVCPWPVPGPSNLCFVPQSSVRTPTRTGAGTPPPACSSSSAAAAMAAARLRGAPLSAGGARPAASPSTCWSCCCRFSASAPPPSSPGSPSWVRGSCRVQELWPLWSCALIGSLLWSPHPSRNLVCHLPDGPGHGQSRPPRLPPGLPLAPGVAVLRSR